MILIIKS